MTNPFDKTNERAEAIFFNKMTVAIDHWLLEKFPQFDTGLVDKLKKVEIEHHRLTGLIREFIDLKQTITESIKKEIIKDVNEFLQKEYPDLDKSLKMTAKNAENKLKKLDTKVKLLEDKYEKIKVSQSVCEDVYKLRDEFKIIKNYMEEFKKRVKRAFEI